MLAPIVYINYYNISIGIRSRKLLFLFFCVYDITISGFFIGGFMIKRDFILVCVFISMYFIIKLNSISNFLVGKFPPREKDVTLFFEKYPPRQASDYSSLWWLLFAVMAIPWVVSLPYRMIGAK
jgi:hypothetical protein